MSWFEPTVVLFEGEDEAAMKAEFVKLCAKHPTRSPLEIGEYVFRGLRDPGTRGSQAGRVWAADLEIQERIDAEKLNGGQQLAAVPSKEVLAAEAMAIARDPATSSKERIAAYKLVAELGGHIIKSVEKKTEEVRRFPAVIFAQYDE